MRLSEWRKRAPGRDAVGARVLAVVSPVLSALGGEADPHALVSWGDDPTSRYAVLVPSTAGLIVCHVRVNVSGDGPRAAAKLVRWSRVQVGELAIETQGGHRIVSFQIEGQVFRAADDAGDEIATFARRVLPAIDGRPLPEPSEPSRPAARRASRPTAARAASRAAASPPARRRATAPGR